MDQSSSLKPRLPRTPMACTKCRGRKVKCIPNESLPGRRCKRCNDNNMECIYISIPEQEASNLGSPSRDEVLWEKSVAAATSSTSLIRTPRATTQLPGDYVVHTSQRGPHYIDPPAQDFTHPPVDYSTTHLPYQPTFQTQNRPNHGDQPQILPEWFSQVNTHPPPQTGSEFPGSRSVAAEYTCYYPVQQVYNGGYPSNGNTLPENGGHLHHAQDSDFRWSQSTQRQ